jgi:hypothetical protein
MNKTSPISLLFFVCILCTHHTSAQTPDANTPSTRSPTDQPNQATQPTATTSPNPSAPDSIAIMIVFPNALIHEDAVGPPLAESFIKTLRDQDEIGAIGYGDDLEHSALFPLKTHHANTYATQIKMIKPFDDEQVRPNVFLAISKAAEELKLSKSNHKFLIIITDGQGRTKHDKPEDFENALKKLQENNFQQFVIMYPVLIRKDHAAQTRVEELKGDGSFTRADNQKDFEQALTYTLDHIYGMTFQKQP